ncbi:barstar family protein [Pseudonocardia sichuanensis]
MTRRLIFDPTAGQAFRDQWQRIDFQLLQNSAVHRVDDANDLGTLARSLAELGYELHSLDASHWRNAADVYDAFSTAMHFPAGGGRNLDALNDWLRDVAEFTFGSSPEATGTVVTVDGFETFHKAEPTLSRHLLEILADKARYASVLGHLMIIIFVSADPEAPSGSVYVNHARPASGS